MCQPILDCLKDVSSQDSYVILTSPDGDKFDQKISKELAKKEEIIIICGHYEGFDGRIYDHIDRQISLGDFILTGGELPAMVMSDAIIRLLKGVIADESTVEESFEDDLLEYRQYTRPEDYNGQKVPSVLLSGHHENIRKYRLKERLKNTYLKRKDLLEKHNLTDEEIVILNEIIEELNEGNNK